MPSEQQLSSVLSEFARTMLTDFPIQGILDHLVERIVDVLPITAAGVTLIAPEAEPHFVAASDESALRYERLQTELGEGPCLAAYRSGEAVSVPDLRVDSRFPLFGPRALEAGLTAVFTFPLRSSDHRLGALDLYRDTAGPLSEGAMEAAQTLADVAAAYLINAQARADLLVASDHAHDLALHDPLTGLPNRTLLLERLDHALRRRRRSGKLTAVLFADLDRFKRINDVHGHVVGDELLVVVAQRLAAVVRPGDTLARMSGDEFVALCEDIDGPAEANGIAERICAAVAAPLVLRGTEMLVTISVGIAFSGPGDGPAEHILQEADAAMYQAKRRGGAHHQFIDLREKQASAQRSGLEHDLQGALARGELHTEYQPIVETVSARTIAFEALLRWDHPSRVPVAPSLFVPLAEQSGLITEIGRWVLERACVDRRELELRHDAGVGISVNVSAHQLMAPDYAASVAEVLGQTGTPPELVVLEMTESVFVQEGRRVSGVLDELKELGVRLALDDFGTGYSSLNYLKRFPIDVVKIDQGFVADLEHDRASHAIVLTVIGLAHLLGMTVVAEGVETAEQHERLTALGCDHCQGFYFASPSRVEDLVAVSGTRNGQRVEGATAR